MNAAVTVYVPGDASALAVGADDVAAALQSACAARGRTRPWSCWTAWP